LKTFSFDCRPFVNYFSSNSYISTYPFQEKLWLSASHNSSSRFCNQVNSPLRSMWQTCFFHLEEDRGPRDWTYWWSWCLYARLSYALHEQPSCLKDCSSISNCQNRFPSSVSCRCLRLIGIFLACFIDAFALSAFCLYLKVYV